MVQGNMHKHGWSNHTAKKRSRSAGSRVWLWLFGIVVVCVICFAAFTYGPPAVRDVGSSLFEGTVGLAVWAVDGVKRLMSKAGGQGPEELGFERLGDSTQDNLYAVP